MRILKRHLAAGIIGVAIFSLGCGSTKNEGGLSFTGIGFSVPSFDVITNTVACGFTNFDNTLSLNIDQATSSISTLSDPRRCFMIQNNLSASFIRTTYMNVQYVIPGASEQPPATRIPFSVVVGADTGVASPAEGNKTNTGNVSTGVLNLGNRASVPVRMITPELQSWLRLNLTNDLPVSVEMQATVVGVTSAGDAIETNPIFYYIVLGQDIPVEPTPAADEFIAGDGTTEADTSTASTSDTSDADALTGVFPEPTVQIIQ